MFTPVPVPVLGKKPTTELILGEIDAWLSSDPLAELVNRFGKGSPEGDLMERLAYLDGFTAGAWNFRKTDSDDVLERNQVDTDAISGDEEQVVLDAAAALGLVTPEPPRYDHYDHVVMLGGLVRANLWRPAYAAYLMRNGVRARNIVALSAYRKMANNEKDPLKDEPNLLKLFGLPPYQYEWEVMEAGLRRAFDLNEMVVEVQSPPETPENKRERVSSGLTNEGKVQLVVAPAPPDKKRATTPDTYEYWAEKVAHVKDGDRVLVVTSCIYVPFQHAAAVQYLGPHGCVIDTVGIDHAAVDDSAAPQQFRGVNYLLEIRSAIIAYRRLVRATMALAKGATG